MNTVFQQETEKFNKLLAIVMKSLEDVGRAVQGVIVMSEELEKVGCVWKSARPIHSLLPLIKTSRALHE